MQLMSQRLPAAIEERSFEIIDNEFGANKPFSGPAWEVARRIIHAAGDPSLAEDLHLPEDAVRAGVEALAAGAPIFTDTMMVKVGISEKKLPKQNPVRCILDSPDIARVAEQEGCTRSRAGMLRLGEALNGAVVVVGNAPTALLALLELCETHNLRPALVVGMPVGFVNAAESKELLVGAPSLPSIALRGRRGGSPLAAATINALAVLARAGDSTVFS